MTEIPISPFVCFDFLKTNFNALKKIQYNIAKIIKRENQKTASKTISKTTNKIDITSHNRIDKISPPIPSPTSIEGISIFGEVLDKSVALKSRNFGKLSISPIPLNSP